MPFILRLIRHISCVGDVAHLETPIGIVRRRGIILCKPGAISSTVRKTLVSVEVPEHSNCGIAINKHSERRFAYSFGRGRLRAPGRCRVGKPHRSLL